MSITRILQWLGQSDALFWLVALLFLAWLLAVVVTLIVPGFLT